MSGPQKPLKVGKDEAGLRLDRWFRLKFPELTHSRLQKLLRTGQIRVDSKRAKSNARLEAGQMVRVPPAVFGETKGRSSVKPPPAVSKADRTLIEKMILYEDEEVLVLNKPFGLAVQGGTGTQHQPVHFG